MSDIESIWYTNLNSEPFFSSLFEIVSYIVDKIVKNYNWFIWG